MTATSPRDPSKWGNSLTDVFNRFMEELLEHPIEGYVRMSEFEFSCRLSWLASVCQICTNRIFLSYLHRFLSIYRIQWIFPPVCAVRVD